MATESRELLYRIQVDASQAVREAERASVAMRGMGSVATTTAGGMTTMGRGVQNASYQVQDFIVQVTGGQDALRAFGQQAPQLLGGFGAVGAAIGVAFALLPPMIEAIKALKDETIELEKAADNARKAQKDLATALDLVSESSFDPLIEQYRDADDETKKLIRTSMQLNITLAQVAAVDLRTSLIASIEEGVEKLGFFNRAWLQFKKSVQDSKAADARGEVGPLRGNAVPLDSPQLLAPGWNINGSQVDEILKAKDAYADMKISATDYLETVVKIYSATKEPTKEFTAWVKSINEATRGQRQLEISVKQTEKFLAEVNSGRPLRTTGERRKAEADAKRDADRTAREAKKSLDEFLRDLAAFEKLATGYQAKQEELLETNRRLTSGQENWRISLERVTESEKKLIELREQQKNGVTSYTEFQQEALENLLQRNAALERANILQADANALVGQARTPLEEYDRTMERLNYHYEAGRVSMQQYNETMASAKTKLAESTPLVSEFTQLLGQAMTAAVIAGDSFADTMNKLVKGLAAVAFQVMIVEPLVKSLKQAMSGLSFFSPTGPSGGSTAGGWTSSANGNAFDSSISAGASNVIPFAKGGVFNTPMTFPMAGGKTGLAFEAGPEAIMPLKRGSDGKLGVSASGGGSTTVVNVYNATGGEVRTEERQDPNGGKTIDVYISKVVQDGIASGQFDRAMTSTYGLRRQGQR
jgi:hypothetical protein